MQLLLVCEDKDVAVDDEFISQCPTLQSQVGNSAEDSIAARVEVPVRKSVIQLFYIGTKVEQVPKVLIEAVVAWCRDHSRIYWPTDISAYVNLVHFLGVGALLSKCIDYLLRVLADERKVLDYFTARHLNPGIIKTHVTKLHVHVQQMLLDRASPASFAILVGMADFKIASDTQYHQQLQRLLHNSYYAQYQSRQHPVESFNRLLRIQRNITSPEHPLSEDLSHLQTRWIVKQIMFSADMRYLCVVTDAGRIYIWDMLFSPPTIITTFYESPGILPVRNATFGPEQTLIISHINDTISIWQAPFLVPYGSERLGTGEYTLHASGKSLLAINRSQTHARLWGPDREVNVPFWGTACSFVFSSLGSTAAWNDNGVICLMCEGLQSYIHVADVPPDQTLQILSFSTNGKSLIACFSQVTYVWNTMTLDERVEISEPARSGAVSPDGRSVALAKPNGSVEIHIPEEEVVLYLRESTNFNVTYAMAWSDDGRSLAVGGRESVSILDVGKEIDSYWKGTPWVSARWVKRSYAKVKSRMS